MGDIINWISLLHQNLASVGQAGLFYGGGFAQLGVQAIGIVRIWIAFAFVVSFVILAGNEMKSWAAYESRPKKK